MPPARRYQAWRSEWKNKAPRAEFSLPTDATFAEAEEAMLDPDHDDQDKKFAALRGVPQPVSSDLCFPMWISARELTSTFSDTEIMTSLGSGSQPAIWSANIHHLREFKTIRNAGISFVCTDRDGHGYAVVNHRSRAFNRGVPHFIQAMRAERKAHPSTPSATRKPAHSPEKTDTRGTSQQMSDVESASFEPPDSDASDASESDDTSVSTMDGIDGEIYVKPSSVWLEEGSPKFPTGSTSDSDLEPERVKRAKQLVFGHVSTPATDFQELPTSQTHYAAFASANTYE
ncbi:hypothetical protein BBJ28_00024909 [Nothophytophthora sp. Chile5]|nr:hypothetical protein BBJ28_00024909 [Nothophytophthora sp. Chile5]